MTIFQKNRGNFLQNLKAQYAEVAQNFQWQNPYTLVEVEMELMKDFSLFILGHEYRRTKMEGIKILTITA